MTDLGEILARELFKPVPMETYRLTWRERLTALNHFRWRQFRTGEGVRYAPQPNALAGLGALVPILPSVNSVSTGWRSE